jgi:hypothetical protein
MIHSRKHLVSLVLAIVANACAIEARAQLFLGQHTGGEDNAYGYAHRFPLAHDRVGYLSGMTIEVRHKIGNLLGEPWEVSSANYTIARDSWMSLSKPGESAFSYRGTTEEFARLEASSRATIAVDHHDPGGINESFTVYVPEALFRRCLRLVGFFYVFSTSGFPDDSGLFKPIEFIRKYDGLIYPPGEWGWNVPGSPSWDRMFCGRNYPHARKDWVAEQAWSSGAHARDAQQASAQGIFSNYPDDVGKSMLATLADEDPRWGRADFFAYNLTLDISALVFEIGRVHPRFVSAYYGRADRAMIGALAGSINTPGATGTERRRALLKKTGVDPNPLEPSLQAAVKRALDHTTELHAEAGDEEIFAIMDTLLRTPGAGLPEAFNQQRVDLSTRVKNNRSHYGVLAQRFAEQLGRERAAWSGGSVLQLSWRCGKHTPACKSKRECRRKD